MQLKKELETLARNNSVQQRQLLFAKLVELFREQANDNNVVEARLFDELLTVLCPMVETPERRAIALQFSKIANAPKNLMTFFALDDIQVAETVIGQYPGFSDDDLIAIAEKSHPQHRIDIARRHNISTNVTGYLIGRAEEDIVSAVLTNPTAQISDKGYEQTARLAGNSGLVLDSICRRTSMPLQTALLIMPHLPHYGQARLLITLNGERGQRIAPRGSKQLSMEQISDLKRMLVARAACERIKKGQQDIDSVFYQHIQAKQLKEVILIISELSGLGDKFNPSVFLSITADQVAHIGRMIRMPKSTFKKLMHMRCERLRMPASSVNKVIRSYDKISKDEVRDTIKKLTQRRT